MSSSNVDHEGVVVGQALRRLRRERRQTQEECAAYLRANGLDWTRAIVAQVETGRRETITLRELALLALAYDIAFYEFFDGDGEVKLTETASVSRANMREALRGSHLRKHARGSAVAVVQFAARAAGEAVRAMVVTTEKAQPIRASKTRQVEPAIESDAGVEVDLSHSRPVNLPHLPTAGFFATPRPLTGDETRSLILCKELNMAPETAAALAVAIWGRPLEDERDLRIGDTSGMSSKELRALRGNVTRTLVDEARQTLAEALEPGGGATFNELFGKVQAALDDAEGQIRAALDQRSNTDADNQ